MFAICFLRLNIVERINLSEGVYKIYKVTKTTDKKQTFLAKGKENVLFNIHKSGYNDRFYEGDLIIANSKLKPIQNPKTLNGFNYKNYLSSKGMHHRLNLKFEDVALLQRDSNSVFFIAQRTKSFLIQRILTFSGIDIGAKGMLVALITGEKSYLKKEDKLLFRDSGVIHVLAISGLHVGVFYLTISFVLFKILRFPKKWGLFFVLIFLIGYAFLTGLSPSVIRATMMFSLIQIGKSFNKEVSTLNIVLSTALLMLFWDPQLLYDIGFQLSFLAVIGIVVVLQHSCVSNIQPPKKFKWLWTLFLVNLSAFTFTSPVLIYHFGIWNLTSLWSSMLVVPMVSIAMYIGMLTMLFSFAGYISFWLVKCFEGLYSFLIFILRLIEEYAHTEISVIFDVFIALCVFSVCLSILLKRTLLLWVGCLLLGISFLISPQKEVEVLSKPSVCEIKMNNHFFMLSLGDRLLFNELEFYYFSEGSLLISSELQCDTINFNVNKYQSIAL